ncbi:MAG: autotransporter outer membrane beta-barrel domain-containing protein, partial [Planctomycetota bacterium]
GLDDETLRGGPYVSWTSGNFYVDGSVTFGYHFYDGSRNIPALDRIADSDFDGYDITGYVGAGYHYEIARDLFVTPIASMQYSYFDFDGFTETGAGGANLNVDSRTVDSLRSRLGANISLKLDWDVDIVPYFFVGWEHEFMDDEDVAARFAPGSSPFLIDTGNPAKDSVFVGGGANVLLKHNVSAFIRYEGSFSDDSDVSGIAGGISIAF